MCRQILVLIEVISPLPGLLPWPPWSPTCTSSFSNSLTNHLKYRTALIPPLKILPNTLVFRRKSKLLLRSYTFPASLFAVLTLYSGLQLKHFLDLEQDMPLSPQTSALTYASTYHTMASQSLGKFVLSTD